MAQDDTTEKGSEHNIPELDKNKDDGKEDEKSKDGKSKNEKNKDKISKNVISKDGKNKDKKSKNVISKDVTSKDVISKDVTSKDVLATHISSLLGKKINFIPNMNLLDQIQILSLISPTLPPNFSSKLICLQSLNPETLPEKKNLNFDTDMLNFIIKTKKQAQTLRDLGSLCDIELKGYYCLGNFILNEIRDELKGWLGDVKKLMDVNCHFENANEVKRIVANILEKKN